MKLLCTVPIAALATAFVVPDEQILADLTVENLHRESPSWFASAISAAHKVSDEASAAWEDLKGSASNAWKHVEYNTAQAFDDALDYTNEKVDCTADAAYGVKEWAESKTGDFFNGEEPEHDHPPHHGPPPPPHGPHHGPPPPHHKPGHGPPHHPHGPPNLTIYEIISKSNYTKKLAKLINEYDDLVKALNSTKANYTIFAPVDAAFDKIPEKAPKPTKEQLKAILSYHVIPDVYTAKRVLTSHTAPTLLKGEHLSSEPEPQRIAFRLGLRGLTVNFYSRIIGINFFAKNGVIHGIDSILLPPPSVIKIIDLLPSEFSTLELGLGKTGLLEKLNTTDHAGGTFFAPSNFAFSKLGPRINAFLFSERGLKYLEALLKYHVVPDITLYTDAYYKASNKKDGKATVLKELPGGKFHIDLPTLLEDHSIAVDLVKFGAFSSFHINGYSRISVADGVAQDGVIHLLSDVLIPPRKLPSGATEWQGEEMSVEELKERLMPYIDRIDL